MKKRILSALLITVMLFSLFPNTVLATQNVDSSILTDYYWYRDVQCWEIFSFEEDGTVNIYYTEIPVNASEKLQLLPESLVLDTVSCLGKWSFNGDTVTIIDSDGYQSKLDLYSKSTNPAIIKDSFVQSQIDEYDGDLYFYSTDWVDDDPFGNANYLVKLGKKTEDGVLPWNCAYYNYILQEINEAGWKVPYYEWVYELMYIDNDSIPELYITYESNASGSRILSYHDGRIIEMQLGSGSLTYTEYGNAFVYSGGKADHYFDHLMTIEQGEFVLVEEYEEVVAWSEDGTSYTNEYFSHEKKISEETYRKNIEAFVPQENAKHSTYNPDNHYGTILSYLASVDEEDASGETNSPYEEYARTAWIEQHMEYAASDEYQSEIVGGYSDRMMAVFRDALNDEDIDSYETRKTVSSILNLDFELSEADMYELILAEILYGESGQSISEGAYTQNLEKTIANMTKVLANIATTGDSAKDIPEDTVKSIKELYELLQTLELGSEEYSTTYGKFISLIKGNVSDIKSKVKTELVGDAAFTGLGIVIDGAFEQYEALEDILNYVNNYVAYQSTSQQTRDVLAKLLVVMYKNQGLAGVDEFIDELGLWDSMMNWADFQSATISIIEAMVKYEQEGAAAVATYAVEREREATSKFGQKAINSVAVFAIEKAASCVPVINTILIAKNVVSVVVSASIILDQIFTNVDEREYALDILTKSYVISVMLDEIVDDCADCMNEDDFYSTTVFDRSVFIYKQNLLNAFGYAVKYADMVLKNAQQELFEYDQEWHLFDGRERLVQAVNWYTNSLAILKDQQVDIESIACHDSNLLYDPLTDEIIYNFKDSRIYIVACPVSVVVKNEAGEQIAYLSGESDQVAEGYEFYFHTIKATADSDEYIKVAIVPDNYQIKLIGTDDGTMNTFVADFKTADVGEVETYFNVPIKKDSIGYFEATTDGSDSTSLVVDEEVYFNMESSEDIPVEANDNNQWIWIAGSVTVVATALFLLLRRKHHKA